MAAKRMTDVIEPVTYWIGVLMSVACVVLVLGSNTDLLGRFERASMPWSWLAGGVAIVALLAAECLQSTSPAPAASDLALEELHQEA